MKMYTDGIHTFYAVQWTGENLKEVIALTGRHGSSRGWTWEEFEGVVKEKGLKIFDSKFPGGHAYVPIGDYVFLPYDVPGIDYVEKDLFEFLYSPCNKQMNTRRIMKLIPITHLDIGDQ